ncbi:AI-2E family transporter [Pontibacter akesuensis]|uniref:Predicted PurR-regulated permease PerM n=1 Tax=Pontibacter akesuensis TaxID=388950 RepID=A0A1I7K6R7_9BACT|nr:AI-2E family transporter [Pontibacter akesuensis]GHA74680.1 AI-2E family transporter [Pontibacter akesuensis]SFU93062.1 Predicted PurR-regulated permease PerM [Pontibacter akesuensis]
MNVKQINHTRINKSLLTIFLVAILLYLGKSFLVPVAIAAFFAMLLFPVVLRLQRRRIKRPIAALISILLLLSVITAIGTLVYYQTKSLEADLPRLEERIEKKTARLQWLLYETTDLTAYEQEEILEEKKPDIAKAVFKSVRDLLVQGFTILLFIFIVLTYTFFFLLYQQKIQNFLVRLHVFDSTKESKVLLARISRIIHDYLKGTFTVIFILGVAYALGFWAIGIEHALLFAMITALLRIIPYFGSFLGIAFPIAFAFLTKDSMWYPVLVLAFFMVTQLLEANLLTPYITGSRVKLNPMATILVILFGNLLWGIPGMILFVPLFASLKVVFDQIPQLSPYAYILGKEDEGLA